MVTTMSAWSATVNVTSTKNYGITFESLLPQNCVSLTLTGPGVSAPRALNGNGREHSRPAMYQVAEPSADDATMAMLCCDTDYLAKVCMPSLDPKD